MLGLQGIYNLFPFNNKNKPNENQPGIKMSLFLILNCSLQTKVNTVSGLAIFALSSITLGMQRISRPPSIGCGKKSCALIT